MKKEMLINVLQPEECRIAIVEDGVLEELYVERTSHESYVGNIYKGKIVNIEPSIQAAFVDFGVGRNGFLHVSDVEPAYYRHLETRRGDAGRRGPGRDRNRGGGGGRDDRSGRKGRRGPQRPPLADTEYDYDPDFAFPEAPAEAVQGIEGDLFRGLEEVADVIDQEETWEAPHSAAEVSGETDVFVEEASSVSVETEVDTGERSAVSEVEDQASVPVTEEPTEPEIVAEEEPAAKPKRRTTRGRSRRKRTPEESSTSAESGEPSTDTPSAETALPASEDDDLPRLMGSAERRTEDEDEAPDGASSSSIDDEDLFFPRSQDVEEPAPSPEDYTYEEMSDVAETAPRGRQGREAVLPFDDADPTEDLSEDRFGDLDGGDEEEPHYQRRAPQGRHDAGRRRGPRGGGGGGRRMGGGRPGAGRPKPLIQDIFKRGQEVIVQVIKEGMGTKGPTLSTYISIAGRCLVLMPSLNRLGVSRKIQDDEQRRRLKEIVNELKPPKGIGFIIRTAAIDRNKTELQNDLAYLSRLWQVVVRRIRKLKAPAEIYQESDMITRTIRDTFTKDIDTIWVDEPNAYEHAREFLQIVMPRYANRIKSYEGREPLFHKYGIEEEIHRIQQRHVPLPNGGSIVIDQTEALVAIDVNSGNFRADNNAEETAYQMNLLAAKEIARQLRLRDLGGVIVNDFIDMRDEKHKRGVEKAMRDAIKRDRARTKVLRMSAFGIIEMTRQRIKQSLKRSVYQDCPHCLGMGHVKTCESMSIEVMRMMQLVSHRDQVARVCVRVADDVATYLLNKKRRDIARLEETGNIQVQISGAVGAPPETLEFACYDNNNNEVKIFRYEDDRVRRR